MEDFKNDNCSVGSIDSHEDNDKTKERESVSSAVTIAKKENQAVTGLRWVLVAVLAIAAVAVSLAVYVYMHGEEVKKFESQFESDASKVFDAIGTNFDLTLGAADAFMYKIASHVRFSKSTWPFVTIPDFAVQAAKLLSVSGAFSLNIHTYIKDRDERQQWEKYVVKNEDWIQESLDVQKRNPSYRGTVVEKYNDTQYSGYIYGGSDWARLPDDLPGPFMPTWQTSPIVPYGAYPAYGWDALADVDTDFPEDMVYCMEHVAPIVTSPVNYIIDPTDADHVAGVEAWSWWASDLISPEENPRGPVSNLFYPIVDSIENVTIDANYRKKIVPPGVIAFSFYWRDKIKNILPPNSIGIVVVFSNTCGRIFTYRIDGADYTFMGAGDVHDANYDYLGKSALFTELTGRDSLYTGIPLDTDFCPLTLSVYPSQDMQDVFITWDPILLALVAGFIFVFVSAIFVAYDLFVARRQRIMMKSAMQSGTLVSSLFPEDVQNRIYQEMDAKAKNRDKKSFWNETDKDKSPNKRQIADLYDNTTIMFADLVGFTSWSSSRTPVQVFELLETLYHAFDVIAERRRVFKVETIGDCYVAVTGLPEPQADHAVIMTKFADHVGTKFRQLVTGTLMETLGEDTANLQLRVGLHSGPTTAGVLRGQKSRFQLFGDTVNTAARMETNGLPGRIHVSQATADALASAGRKLWLTPREDLVLAKGKGEMQTYWVQVSKEDSQAGTVRTQLTYPMPE